MPGSMYDELVRHITRLERRIEAMDQPETGVLRSTLNVSNPPTDAELDAEFGAPADFHRAIIIDDAGGGANYWFVVSDGSAWLYVAMTAAV